MSLTELPAFLTLVGFATQRAVELADPLTVTLSSKGIAGLDAAAAKTWLCNIVSFAIGLTIAFFCEKNIPGVGRVGSMLVLGLAISTGTNAANSLVKYAEYIKEGRKGPTPPTVQVFPTTVSLKTAATFKFVATISGTTNTKVTWLLQHREGGTINEATGEYTAPTVPGSYLVVAQSAENSSALGGATVTVTA